MIPQFTLLGNGDAAYMTSWNSARNKYLLLCTELRLLRIVFKKFTVVHAVGKIKQISKRFFNCRLFGNICPYIILITVELSFHNCQFSLSLCIQICSENVSVNLL